MHFETQHNGQAVTLTAEADGGNWRVTLPDGTARTIGVRRLPGGVLQIVDGARVFRVPVARTERGMEAFWQGAAFVFAPPEKAAGRTSGRTGKAASGALTAPMAGVVADVLVEVGQSVAAFQPVAAVEAMKVYATLEAPFAGTVAAVHAQKGDRVAHGAALVDITPDNADGKEDTP